MNSEENKIISDSIRKKPQAQRLLYEKYRVRWFMICLRYAKDRMQAEDMLQEGLISVFTNLKQFDNKKASFSAWSGKIMVNAALQHLRKWKNIDFHQDIDDYEDKLEHEDEIVEDLGAKELTSLIQQMPDGYRVVFNMYVVEGYKHKEIAELLNISENTSKTQLLKAKKMLRNKLETVLNT